MLLEKLFMLKTNDYKKKYTFLEHQNTIGAIIFTSCLFSMLLTSYLYIYGFLAWYHHISVMAILISFLLYAYEDAAENTL